MRCAGIVCLMGTYAEATRGRREPRRNTASYGGSLTLAAVLGVRVRLAEQRGVPGTSTFPSLDVQGARHLAVGRSV
jgi:hypothetical protein